MLFVREVRTDIGRWRRAICGYRSQPHKAAASKAMFVLAKFYNFIRVAMQLGWIISGRLSGKDTRFSILWSQFEPASEHHTAG